MSLVRGRDFSALLQKVKIKIQNDVIVHQSASQIAWLYCVVRCYRFYQCFKAVKCEYSAFKIDRKILMLTPGPLDRTFSSQIDTKILMLTPGPLFDLRSNVFKSSFQVFQVKRLSSS